jgi:hypothetical protein
LELKAYNLVSGLPAYWEMGTYENNDTKKYNLRDAVIKCRNNYYMLAQRYVEYGIVQDIYELTEYML